MKGITSLAVAAMLASACSDRPREQTLASAPSDKSAKPVATAGTEAGTKSDAAILEDFNARISRYMQTRKEAGRGADKPKETKDPGRISAAQDTLADRISARRADAKQGDIFTAEIRGTFRRLLAPELKGAEGRDAKDIMKDEAPAPGTVSFKVNAKYPEGQPRPTMPTNVLLSLPEMPKPLEYRIIGRHLLLIDTDADLVVDYIPNAING